MLKKPGPTSTMEEQNSEPTNAKTPPKKLRKNERISEKKENKTRMELKWKLSKDKQVSKQMSLRKITSNMELKLIKKNL